MIYEEMGEITKNIEVAQETYLMKLVLNSAVQNRICPGQFLHLQLNNINYYGAQANNSTDITSPTASPTYMLTDPFLRRPFSIHDVEKLNSELAILYKIVGKGTFLLSKRQPGERLKVLAPLGRGFTLAEEKKVLLISGGMGIAPMYFLMKELMKRQCKVTVLAGFNNKKQSEAISLLENLGCDVQVCTEDGSIGHHGLVIDLFEKHINSQGKNIDFIYTCGPEKMMAKIASRANNRKIPVELSLEKQMACGIGACKGCTCVSSAKSSENRSSEYGDFKYTCIDGPVFNGKEVVLDG